jgi:signal transduction histidine kinase
MRKLLFLLFLLSALYFRSIAQFAVSEHALDSLKELVPAGKDDTLKIQTLLSISFAYVFSQPDSGLVYAKQALIFSQQSNYSLGVAYSYYLIGYNLSQLGDFAAAMSFGFRSLNLFRSLNNQGGTIISTEAIGGHYRNQGDYKEALKYLFEAKKMAEALPPGKTYKTLMGYEVSKENQLFFQYAEIGFSHITSNPDSALFYATKPYISSGGTWLYSIVVIGNAYLAKNQFDSALHYFQSGLRLMPISYPNDIADNYIGIANVFRKEKLYDSCIFYAKRGLDICQHIAYEKGIYEVSAILASVYESIDPVQSIKYYKLNKATNDSLFSQQKAREVQSFAFNEQLHQQELQQKIEQTQLVNKNRQHIIILLAGLLMALIVAIGLWRKNIYKQKSYSVLQKQKQETDMQKTKAEQTLEELKTTQAQLIQSEKMASLGELTAGIAHEIQNPLNFVNNFSEVNNELIEELKSEKSRVQRERDEDLESEILNDIYQNNEKINLHGKRADAIVKGMLQHSRTSTGQKEPTAINALCDEYLRLSYHGLRAKDKSFNAEIKTDFDQNVDKVNVVPQDIGRVLLNLFNNAFYAANERCKAEGDPYVPSVTVVTKRLSDKIEIEIKDNGNGIAESIKEKIFQPFFTTKPTGQGTGLGLSLAYDIIKAHGGEIKVETKEGNGCVFVIQLPVAYKMA